ncbi:hypothetical protein F511_33725 [Dorcoceras hygrometricum]|uniref:DUF4219 domain-containing protein n=1 Tax=Dorcoceras hygrometricum TaxID=472368 RepID=A0A2Z7A5Z0_9LAMI|nr:hypothetical protein F511_33725 [Dorcoceras hygrometricum]
MSTSHNKIPLFSREDYDDWKIRMQAHLAALDDEMWVVLTEGPLKIMKPNLAFAISNGEPQFLEKARHEYTSEDKKKANLDNVARDILYKTLDSNAIVGAVTTGYECLPPSCDGLTGPDDHGPMISRLIDRGALGNQAGPSGCSAGRSPRH